jgi:hypothetical protein
MKLLNTLYDIGNSDPGLGQAQNVVICYTKNTFTFNISEKECALQNKIVQMYKTQVQWMILKNKSRWKQFTDKSNETHSNLYTKYV